MLRLLKTVCTLASLMLGACLFTSSAEANGIILPYGDYVFPTTMSELGYQEPINFDGPDVQTCEIAKKDAIVNYNAYMEVLGRSQNVSMGIIGKSILVKMSWCHYDIENSKNFVVITMTGSEQQIERDKIDGRTSSGPIFITFFDGNGDILRWSY